MDDGITVEVIEIGHDPGLEFGLGCYPDMAEHRVGDFRKEAFDQVETRAVFGRKDEAKASLHSGRGFPGDMGRMLVEGRFDDGL